MNISKSLIFLSLVLGFLNAKSQTINDDSLNINIGMNINEDFVDDRFEKLDIAWLEQNAKKSQIEAKFNYRCTIEKDSVIVVIDGNSIYGYSLFKYFDNQCFKIVKEYYPNGNVKEKGWVFNNSGTKKGIWYEFDEDGNLARKVDYDKLTKVTFEDVLRICRKENIPLLKGRIPSGTGQHTYIVRYFDDAASCYRWSIDWLKGRDLIEDIVLDANNGKILQRIEREFRIR